MARIRTIKPEFPQSESMGNVSRDARGHFKKKAITTQDRRNLATRYGGSPGARVVASCIYCGTKGAINWVLQQRGAGWVQFIGLEIEHKHPEFSGGAGGDNLDLACLPCNRSKGAKTLEQWKGKPCA